MSNDSVRAVACLLFGAALVGALATSFLHVAAFFAPVVPTAWPGARFVAALSLDVLAAAAGYGLIVTGGARVNRAWLHVGLWAAVALSVWANWRFASEHVAAGAWAADAIVSALLPVLAVVATHGLAAVLRAIPADVDGMEILPATVPPATVAAPGVPAITREEARAWVEAGQLPPNFATSAELARALDLHPSRISEWRRGAATARRNGAGGGE